MWRDVPELSHRIHLYSNRPNLHCVFILHKQICFSLLLIAGYTIQESFVCVMQKIFCFFHEEILSTDSQWLLQNDISVRRPLKFGLKVGNHFYFFQQCHD